MAKVRVPHPKENQIFDHAWSDEDEREAPQAQFVGTTRAMNGAPVYSTAHIAGLLQRFSCFVSILWLHIFEAFLSTRQAQKQPQTH